ncbi:hypothetical protein M0R19_04025 [Candidatus Pacearchaeota archaeon]|nr:hypothetical protein [Candidatus Pacearchaeota archaeon]
MIIDINRMSITDIMVEKNNIPIFYIKMDIVTKQHYLFELIYKSETDDVSLFYPITYSESNLIKYYDNKHDIYKNLKINMCYFYVECKVKYNERTSIFSSIEDLDPKYIS